MNYFERVNQHYSDKVKQYNVPYNAEAKRHNITYTNPDRELNSMDYFENTKLNKKLKNIYPRGKVFHSLQFLKITFTETYNKPLTDFFEQWTKLINEGRG